jgi:HSP20 family molecular chaperone IbpA
VKESAVEYQFKDGVLRVTLPKVEQVLPKKIEVKS